MKQALIINILNMQNWLLTADAQKSEAYLNDLTVPALWLFHDNLVADLKKVDDDQ